jgi:predicted sulfurtransferase
MPKHSKVTRTCKAPGCQRRFVVPRKSKRRYCFKCTGKIVNQSIKQMRSKRGAIHDKWIKNLVNAVHGKYQEAINRGKDRKDEK